MIKFIGGLFYYGEKEKPHQIEMTEGKRNIIQQLFQKYEIEMAEEDIQGALKDLLCGTINERMEIEMDNHLGYQEK